MPNKDRKKRSSRVARQKRRAELEELHKASGYTPNADAGSKKSISKAEGSSKKNSVSKTTKANGKPKLRTRIANYFKLVRTEMHKVVWPSKTELRNWSLGVIVMLVVFGVCVWLVDTGFVALLVSYTSLRG